MFRFFTRLWSSETQTVTMAALIVGAASLISRLVGMYRDRILASTFGAGDVLDAYYAAFKIPDVLYNLIILGALSAAFIPVFTEYIEKRNEAEAWKLAEFIFSIVACVMAVACVTLYLLTPQIVPFIAPGFSGETRILTLSLTRVMLLSTFFLSLSAVMGGVLQSLRRFVAFSLAPVFYNVGIIIGVVAFVPIMGPMGLGWGVVVGAFFHFFTQAIVAWPLGFRRLRFPSFRHEGVRRMLVLMAPRALGLGIAQMNLIILLAFASTLAVGTVAVFNLAMNLQSVPIGIFGVSFAVAAFPVLSRAASHGHTETFKIALSSAARKIVFLVLPCMALMLILRAQIVRLILGDGAFDWNDTIRTADALGLFSLSLVVQALVPLLARGFYALQNTWTPLWIGLASQGLNILLALILLRPFGLMGIVFAFTIASWVWFFLLWWRLRAVHGSLGTKEVWTSFLKTIVACFILAGVAIPVRIAIGTLYPLRTFWQVALQFFGASLMGLLAFWIVSWLLKSKELEELRMAILRKYWKRGVVLEGAEAAQG